MPCISTTCAQLHPRACGRPAHRLLVFAFPYVASTGVWKTRLWASFLGVSGSCIHGRVEDPPAWRASVDHLPLHPRACGRPASCSLPRCPYPVASTGVWKTRATAQPPRPALALHPRACGRPAGGRGFEPRLLVASTGVWKTRT